MPVSLSLKQVYRKLGDVEDMFAQHVVLGLELWVAAANDLEGHPQYACTEATRQLVYTAQGEGPWTGRQPQLSYKSWLHKHIHSISAAMKECVLSQLDICTKRLGILQSLVTSKQGSVDHQLLARLEPERQACMRVEVQVWVLAIILSVSALCDALSELSTSNHMAIQNKCLQGEGAINMVAWRVYQARCTCNGRVIEQLLNVRDRLPAMGMSFHTSGGLDLERIMAASRYLAETDIMWLRIAGRVPPNYMGTAQFMSAVYWPGLYVGLGATLKVQDRPMVKLELCRLLAHPELIEELDSFHEPSFLTQILCGVQVSARDLQVAGVDAKQQQLLLSRMGSMSHTEPDGPHMAGSCSNLLGDKQTTLSTESTLATTMADHSQVVGVDSMGSASASEAIQSVFGLAAGDDLYDAQTLLRMMYG